MRTGLFERLFPAVVAAFSLAVLGLAGCDRPQADTQKAKGGPPPASVVASQPVVRELVEWDEYTGRFDAVESVEIRARVSGYLMEVGFKDGQTVKKGDLLFVIDPRPFQRAVEQARAELEQARTKVENAMLDVERGRPLLERKVMSEKVFDDRANLMREAQAAVKVAQAKVATAELELSFTRVGAPLSGRIGRSIQSVGNWVTAGTANNASVLAAIVSEDPIHIYFDVSENNYIKYLRLSGNGNGGATRMGARVEIAMPDERNFPHAGVLDFLDNRLDQGTATLRARARVDNPARLFLPGMFARVRIAGSPRHKALLVVDAAIGTDQAAKYVLVVGEDNKVVRRTVTLGPLDGGLRIVRSGIKPDDWVITVGTQRARPGQVVNPKRGPMPPPGPAGIPRAGRAPAVGK